MPATDWKEVQTPDEAKVFEGYAEVLRRFQREKAQKYPIARGLHGKPHAAVEGTLTIHADLPEHAKHGIGAQPGTYRAIVRWSNGNGGRLSDTEPDVRGIAVKAIGVKGKKLIPGMEDAVTQDFLAILGSATPFVDAHEFVWFVENAPNRATLPLKILFRFGPSKFGKILKKLLASAKRKPASLATAVFNSNVPIRWGPYAVRYQFAPVAPPEAGKEQGPGRDYFGEELRARLANGPVEYDLQLQFFENEAATPIEDGTVEWSSPFLTIGRLTIPKQTAQAEHPTFEQLSFDPWHALVEHRPLGSMQRARNAAYRLSTQERKAAPEPT